MFCNLKIQYSHMHVFRLPWWVMARGSALLLQLLYNITWFYIHLGICTADSVQYFNFRRSCWWCVGRRIPPCCCRSALGVVFFCDRSSIPVSLRCLSRFQLWMSSLRSIFNSGNIIWWCVVRIPMSFCSFEGKSSILFILLWSVCCLLVKTKPLRTPNQSRY